MRRQEKVRMGSHQAKISQHILSIVHNKIAWDVDSYGHQNLLYVEIQLIPLLLKFAILGRISYTLKYMKVAEIAPPFMITITPQSGVHPLGIHQCFVPYLTLNFPLESRFHTSLSTVALCQEGIFKIQFQSTSQNILLTNISFHLVLLESRKSDPFH